MRLHLIDGTYELFRAHYSKRPSHKAKAGWDAKATVGVVQSLLALLAEPTEACTHLAVAFDNPIRSFRNDLFAGYKSDDGIDADLRSQFDAVEEAVAALGVTVWSMNKFEADDAMATGAVRYAKDFEQIRLMTPDKDLGQCIRGTKVVQVDRRQEKVTDEAAFRAARGFGPKSMPDYLALTGDSADGIPGLEGWGEKGAAKVLAEFEKLENIPAEVSKWKNPPRGAEGLAATLQREFKNALLYRQLATVREDVPLKESAADLKWKGAPRKQFEKWCDEVGTQSMKERPKLWK